MKIIWAGQSCFQISISGSKEQLLSLVIDPFDETIGLKVPDFQADILLVSHQHYDHNNVKAVKGNPFLITEPGEYEVKGVYIEGIPAFHDNVEGKEKGRVIIYTIEAEGLRMCHLGDLGQKQLTDDQLEKIGNVDVLMIPTGGTYTISSLEAPKIISQIEPNIVIPMHYQLPKLKLKLEGVDKFLKAMGKNSLTAENKFSVKSNTINKEGMEIVVLQP